MPDLKAVVERDPASGRLIEPFLFFKGFAAIQTQRIAHHLWLAGRRDMAMVLQKPLVVGVPDGHPSGRDARQGHLSSTTPPVSSSARRWRSRMRCRSCRM